MPRIKVRMKTVAQLFLTLSLIVILVFPANGSASPEEHKIDSLEKALNAQKSPSDRVPVLLQLSSANKAVNNPKAISYALQAYDISLEADNESGILQSMLQLTWLYYIETDYAKSLEYAVKSKELAEKLGMKAEAAQALDAMGTIYSDFGDMDKSSECYFKSLKIFDQLKDIKGLAQSSSRIGVLYYKQKNYSKALEYLRASLDYSKQSNASDGIVSNLNSIANVYADQGDFQKAIKNYMEALDLAVKNSDLRMEGSVSLSVGTTYLKMKKYSQSVAYFQRALAIFNKLNNQLRIAKCKIQFGEYYYQTGDYRKGAGIAAEALRVCQQQGFREVELSAATLLHKLSLATKDTLSAYRYLLLENEMKDSLAFGERKKMLTKLESQYQFDKAQAEKAIIQQRKSYVTVILVLVLISGLIILFLFWGRLKVKAKNTLLQKESLEKELEFKNKEMVLNVMSLMKKNEMLADLSEKLIRIDSEVTSSEGKDTIKKVARELQKGQEDEIWKEFSLRFKEVHGDFYNSLLAKYPTLGPNDLKLCAFLRLNMSSKDIAALTGQRVSSLETARHRLRQKLGISNSDVNLITFLSQF